MIYTRTGSIIPGLTCFRSELDVHKTLQMPPKAAVEAAPALQPGAKTWINFIKMFNIPKQQI